MALRTTLFAAGFKHSPLNPPSPYIFLQQFRKMSTPSQPKEGASETGVFKVQPTDLASVVSPTPDKDVYPAVFSTARMVAFMEIVSARLIVPHLKPGQLSVGATVNITHSAATPVGEEVSVTSTFVGMAKGGKVFAFDVVATDVGGEIGRARHERALIDESRLMSGAQKRIEAGRSKL